MAKNPQKVPAWLHAVVEWSPALIFFLIYQVWGFFAATAAAMPVTLLAVTLTWRLGRRIPVLPLVTLFLVVVLGGLTLWFRSELFAKLIPTVVSGLFSAILLFGYLRDLPVLKHAIGAQMPDITAAAWRRLTLRYALFFAGLAVLNEFIWRTQSTELWVAYKTYGDLGLLLLFIASQVPFVGRHRVANQAEAESSA